MNKEQQEKLWARYEEAERTNGSDDRWIKWLKGNYSKLVEAENGLILHIEKSRIDTHFCFGHGFCGVSSEEEEQRASGAAHYARTNENYFIRENLEKIEEEIQALNDPQYIAIAWGSGTKGVSSVSFAKKFNYEYYPERFKGTYVLTDTDKANYLEALEEEKADFTKRLNTYLKRYGLSKLKV